jgi:hypothetical protein
VTALRRYLTAALIDLHDIRADRHELLAARHRHAARLHRAGNGPVIIPRNWS